MTARRGRVGLDVFLARMLCAFAILTSLGTRASAQTLRGRLTESGDSSSFISAGYIRAFNMLQQSVAESMTDFNGHFVIQLPMQGPYYLIIQRIGYEAVRTDTFTVVADRIKNFAIRATPVQLRAIHSEAKRKCSQSEALTVDEIRLWDQIQAALNALQWTDKHVVVAYEWQDVFREIDPKTHAVRDSLSRSVTDAAFGSLFASQARDSLLRHGFIQRKAAGYAYYGPDAGMILSQEFQQAHCFRSVKDETQPGQVGLRFFSKGKIKPFDVEGTLWVDGETARLTHLTFTYDRSPYDAPKGSAGGDVHFAQLNNGMWIVDAWRIWKPAMAEHNSVAVLQERANVVTKASIDGEIMFRRE